MAKGGFYAVANGRKVGVYGTWDECRKQVDGFAKARSVLSSIVCFSKRF